MGRRSNAQIAAELQLLGARARLETAALQLVKAVSEAPEGYSVQGIPVDSELFLALSRAADDVGRATIAEITANNASKSSTAS